jgi:hypothetical protein
MSDVRIQFGDFQTPLPLARAVCELLTRHGVAADSILEPTCGTGSFLLAAAERFPSAHLNGRDINPDYVAQARAALAQANPRTPVLVQQQDFFTHDWTSELAALPGAVLVLGNLPWVTNAAVSVRNGWNLPAKENFPGYRGLEARTGKSNFDISEWMLMRLLQGLRTRGGTLALLCKTSVARKALRFAWLNDGRITRATLYRIDAKAHFKAAVEACLLVVRCGSEGPHEAEVYDALDAESATNTLGLAGKELVSDVVAYRQLRHLEGTSAYQWRSGIKHDCASVMELRRVAPERFQNKLGEEILLETEQVFPLLKCSDLAHARTEPSRWVLVTQRRVGDDTTVLAKTAPRTWEYLQSHRALFDARKSSIYRGAAPFSLFGIGEYSFAPWKVAVSGLHRPPGFVVIGPYQGRPVVLDDTCYFLPFDGENAARKAAQTLNSPLCQRFLAALTFPEAKRPITVELLQRVNMNAVTAEIGLPALQQAQLL